MIKRTSLYILVVSAVAHGLHAEESLQRDFSTQDMLETVAETTMIISPSADLSLDLTRDVLDFENPHSADPHGADPLEGIDVFRFEDDADDYDFICNQLPVIQPARWQLILGNLTGAVVIRWNALSKFVGRHWNRLTNKTSKKKLVRNRNHA